MRLYHLLELSLGIGDASQNWKIIMSFVSLILNSSTQNNSMKLSTDHEVMRPVARLHKLVFLTVLYTKASAEFYIYKLELKLESSFTVSRKGKAKNDFHSSNSLVLFNQNLDKIVFNMNN